MKNRRKQICLLITVSLLLLIAVVASVGTTFAKYKKEIELSQAWSVVIPGSGSGAASVTPSDDGGESDDADEAKDTQDTQDTQETQDTHETVYTVQPGDTLSALAEKFGTTVAALAAYNHIENADLIQVGMILQIPPADYVVPEAEETEPAETEAVETEAVETEAPETESAETEAVETEAPETEAVETEAAETELPDEGGENG